jgi:hypothetical protein
LIALSILSVYLFWQGGEISRPIGVLSPDEPLQSGLSTSSSLEKKGYRVAHLAGFENKARVNSSSRYRYDRGAELAPIDLVLGWGLCQILRS